MDVRPLAEASAQSYGLDPLLVRAIIAVESSGKPHAYRFEQKYWERYRPLHPEWAGLDPERVAASYGLMQVMYPTAQQIGFTMEPEYLFVPQIGIDIGCRWLSQLLHWAGTFGVASERTLGAAVAAYNGGKGGNKPTDSPLRNGAYAQRVWAARAFLSGTQTSPIA